MTSASIHVRSKDSRQIVSEEDIVSLRSVVKRVATLLGFSIINQTKLVTAASEIARNLLDYGGGGEFIIEVVENGSTSGLRLCFTDNGPGIADIETAMQDGFSTARGMGLGLGGSKRLVDEFEIDSQPGKGTRVTLTKWN